MKKILLISLLIFFTVISLVGQEDLAALVAGAGNKSDFPDASHIMVFDRTHVKMMDSGLSHVTKEILYKVLTTEGAKELKSLVFGYDPLSAYVEVKAAAVIKKSGKKIDLPLETSQSGLTTGA